MKTKELWENLLYELQDIKKENPLKTDVRITKEHNSYYITEIWKENDDIFYKVENLDNKFNLSKESVKIQKQLYNEIIDIMYDNKTILSYLQHGEKCYCGSYEYNDAESPDYWIFKRHKIYITQEGLFDIDYKCSNKNTTFSTLKEAILYVKSLKQ